MLHMVLITKVKPSKQVRTVSTQQASPSVKLCIEALFGVCQETRAGCVTIPSTTNGVDLVKSITAYYS